MAKALAYEDQLKKPKPRYWTIARKRSVTSWIFMAPAMLMLAIFVFYPLVYGVILAFFKYDLINPAKFIGFDNFTRAFKDEDFRVSLIHSAEFVLVVPPIQLAAIALALLINTKLRGISIFRFAFYLPVVTSLVVAAVVWKWIYQPDFGLLNSGLHWASNLLNGGPIRRWQGPQWLTDPKLALPAIAVVTFWRGIGYYMVIYLAGLQSIPKDLEEAARIDGAGTWGVLRYITIPLLIPSIALASILSTIAALRIFDEFYVMTGSAAGNPLKSTLVANVYIFGTSFGAYTGKYEFGYAAALSLLLSVVIWIFTILNLKVLNKGGVVLI